MKWLAVALVCAVGIIGVETWLLMEPVPPPPPELRVIAIPPPAPVRLRPVVKRKVVRAASHVTAEKAQRGQFAAGSQRPFVMPTGDIFSGVDPQDPRIYHFAAE